MASGSLRSHARPKIRIEEPELKGETKAERARRLARNRKVRPANKVKEEGPKDRKRRLEAGRSRRRRQEGAQEEDGAVRSQRRRQEGTREANVAARAQKRRREGTREENVAVLSQKRRHEGDRAENVSAQAQKRRQEGDRDADVAVLSQKRRQEGTHEADVAVRPQKRRKEGTHETDVAGRSQRSRQEGAQEADDAARSQKRRQGGTHEPGVGARSQMRRRQVMGDNNPIGKPNSPGAGKVVDPEGRIRVLCYRDGVSYKNQTTGETSLIRDRRRDRLKLLARRTGRAETWRDECPIADRAEAIGAPPQRPTKRKRARNIPRQQEKRSRQRSGVSPN